jgi:hypothetical protein
MHPTSIELRQAALTVASTIKKEPGGAVSLSSTENSSMPAVTALALANASALQQEQRSINFKTVPKEKTKKRKKETKKGKRASNAYLGPLRT